MSKVLINMSNLENIADAIRQKNGESTLYKPSEMAAAIGRISGGGYPEPTGSISITENGTHNVKDYSSAVVNVSGVTLMSASAWDALTTAQKQAYGLVAIRDTDTGFNQGRLVFGANYVPIGIHLPYSDKESIICEAFADNFDPNAIRWGVGVSPVQLTKLASLSSLGDSVLLPAKTEDTYGYVDLGAPNTPFTAYIVGKTVNPTQYNRIFSAFRARRSGNGIMLYGSTVTVSSWADDTDTDVPSSAYFVGAIQYATSGSFGIVGNTTVQPTNFIAKSPTVAGQYVTIGRTDTDPSTANAEPCDMDVKYVAVVKQAETRETVTNNMNYLIDTFL